MAVTYGALGETTVTYGVVGETTVTYGVLGETTDDTKLLSRHMTFLQYLQVVK